MPFPDEPCPTCPRSDRGLPMPCRAMATGHARFCELAAEGREGYVALLCDELPEPVPIEPPARAAIPVAESTRRIKLARECPHRTNPKCGCAGIATCLLGKGRDGQVSLSECIACVVGQEPG